MQSCAAAGGDSPPDDVEAEAEAEATVEETPQVADTDSEAAGTGPVAEPSEEETNEG